MNKSFIFIAIIVVTTTGCTMFARTNPVAVGSASKASSDRVLMYQEKVPEYFLMTVTRDEGIMGSACFIGLEINGKLAARFDPRETVSFYIPSATPALQVVRDPFGRGLCSSEWTPVQETYELKAKQNNLFRISLGAYRRPRLLPAFK